MSTRRRVSWRSLAALVPGLSREIADTIGIAEDEEQTVKYATTIIEQAPTIERGQSHAPLSYLDQAGQKADAPRQSRSKSPSRPPDLSRPQRASASRSPRLRASEGESNRTISSLPKNSPRPRPTPRVSVRAETAKCALDPPSPVVLLALRVARRAKWSTPGKRSSIPTVSPLPHMGRIITIADMADYGPEEQATRFRKESGDLMRPSMEHRTSPSSPAALYMRTAYRRN